MAENGGAASPADGSGAQLGLELRSTLSQVAYARQEADSYLRARGVSARTIHAVSLGIEELLTNIIQHGHDGRSDAVITVVVCHAPGAVRLCLVDDAPPFDPTSAPRPASATSLTDARIGGRGLTMVRHYAHLMRYERRDERNRLEVEFVD